jgi:hypothetical protein
MAEVVETNVPSVYVSDLEKLTERIRKVTGEENVEVSFEFIIASLFPTSWNNIQSALTHQYTLGYIQGQKDEQEERIRQIRTNDESDCYCE